MKSKPAEIRSDMWSKHTLHALKAALLLHPVLGNCQYGFYEVPETVALNLVRVKDQGLVFKLHHRLLNFEFVHSTRESCPLFQSGRDGVVDKDAVCDCAVEELLDLLLPEIHEMTHDDKKYIKRRHKDLLDNMPRHVRVRQQRDFADLKVEISWEVLVSEHFGTDFEVFLLSETSWDAVREGHRYYKTSNAESAEDPQSPLSSDSSSPQTQLLNEPPISSSTSQSMPATPKAPHAEYVWRGKTSTSARTIHLDESIPPGNHYIAVIRSIAHYGALYSLPFIVNIPCPSPRHVFVEREDPKISVKWTCFSFPADFKIVCSSIYDTLRTSEMISGTSYDFNVEGSEDLDLGIQICAVANGVQSRDRLLQVEAKRDVSEEMDEEICWESSSPGSAPASTLYEWASSGGSETSLSEGCGDYRPDTEGESVNDGSEDYVPYIEGNNVDSPEVESPARLGGKEDEVFVRENSVISRQKFRGRRLTHSPPPGVETPRLAIPSPQAEEEARSSRVESSICNPTSTSDRTPSHSENMEPSSLNPILPLSLNQGSTCRVKLTDGLTRIIYIHRHNQETQMLTVTNFLSEGLLAGNLQDPAAEGEERLFMVYKNWMLAGEEADAEQLASCEVLEVSEDNIQIRKPDDANNTSSSVNTITSSSSVEWAIKVEDRLHEIRSLHNSKENINNYPTDHEILKRGNIAYHIGSGIPGWSVGFEKAGFRISVAAGLDEISLQMWKVSFLFQAN